MKYLVTKTISCVKKFVWSFSLVLIAISSGCGSDDTEESPAVLGPESGIVVETLNITGDYLGDDAISIGDDGSLYVSHLASAAGKTIFKVSPNGSSTAFSRDLTAPMGHTFNAENALIVAFNGPNFLGSIDSGGALSTFLEDSRFQGGSLVADSEDNLYHTVFATNRIYKISPDKEVELLASGGPLNVPFGITLDDDGNVYAANFSDGRINKVTSSGELSTLADLPASIGYITFTNGQLYATGFSNHRIYRVSLEGSYEVLIGSGEPESNDGVGGEVAFASPNGIAASRDGRFLYVTQKNFQIRRLTLE